MRLNVGQERFALAERLRAILGDKLKDIRSLASELGVEELSLCLSTDVHSPHPTVAVLTAVIKHYGVDPGYMLTGVYNSSTHQRVLESDRQAISTVVQELVLADDRRLAREHELGEASAS